MRELHVVALSSDGKHLVLSAKKGSLRGSYLVRVGPRLTRALDGELREPGSEPPAPPAESALTPKEIQSRLRAGQSPDRVAKAAGVPVDRITRFEGPVLSERALILDAVRAATLIRARSGPSAAALGDAVRLNLAERGTGTPDSDDWTTFRRPDGRWVVRLEVTVRGRSRRAEWLWEPTAREISANDAYSAALGHVAGRAAKAAPRRPAPAKKPTARRATAATKPAARRRASAR